MEELKLEVMSVRAALCIMVKLVAIACNTSELSEWLEYSIYNSAKMAHQIKPKAS